MRKVKLSDSEVRLLLLFLAILMFAGAYFLSFQRNMERAEEMEAKNETDRAYVEMLESMVARRPLIEAQTEEYRQTVMDIIAKYPSDVPTEKAIEIIQQIEDRVGVHMGSISFSVGNTVADLGVGAWTEDEDGQVVLMDVPSVGYRDTLGMSYDADYRDFKELVAYIGELADRTTIPSITASYDSVTGKVSGSITINMFYLTATGKEYIAPDVTGKRKGVSNIFLDRGTGITSIGE